MMERDYGRGAASWGASHILCRLPLHKPDPCPAGVASSPLAWKDLCADSAASIQDPSSQSPCLGDQSLLSSVAAEARMCARA